MCNIEITIYNDYVLASTTGSRWFMEDGVDYLNEELLTLKEILAKKPKVLIMDVTSLQILPTHMVGLWFSIIKELTGQEFCEMQKKHEGFMVIINEVQLHAMKADQSADFFVYNVI